MKIFSEKIFDWYVLFAHALAKVLNLSYKEFNVWVWGIIVPLILFIMFIMIKFRGGRIYKLRKLLKDLRNEDLD